MCLLVLLSGRAGAGAVRCHMRIPADAIAY